MSDFETIMMMLLIPVYGIMFYIAGKINLVELIIKMAEEEFKKIKESGGKNYEEKN